jgi:hypothetical protein
MDHKRIYNEIINRRKVLTPNGYIERHHIIPKCIGGLDDKSNIVSLTAREHYICHLLLAKIYPCQKTLYALWMMQCGAKQHKRPNIRNGKMYEWARKKFAEYIGPISSKANSGKNNPMSKRRWISHIENRECKTILKNEVLPEGWVYGKKTWIRLDREAHQSNLQQMKQDKLRLKYLKLYEIYNSSEYNSIREFANSDLCDVSQPSLTRSWKKYISDFNPVGRTSHKPRP